VLVNDRAIDGTGYFGFRISRNMRYQWDLRRRAKR